MIFKRKSHTHKIDLFSAGKCFGCSDLDNHLVFPKLDFLIFVFIVMDVEARNKLVISL